MLVDVKNYIKDLAIISLVAVVFLSINWIGFYGSDDWEYSEAALQWIANGLFLGDTHWALRHTHVLAIAASYAAFGPGEFQLLLPTVMYFFLTLFTVYYMVNKFISRNAAMVSCLVLTSTPVLIIITTMTRPDITEAFFVLLSVFLFWNASRSAAPARMLFVSGVAAGLGWITRETTVGLLIAYGLFFLAGRCVERRYYWIMAAGFGAILASDAGYSALMKGDPLYRYKTIITSATAALRRNIGDQAHMLGMGETASSVAGNISTNWVIDPFLAILVNQEFGLTFWLAIPVALWLCFSGRVDPRHRELAQFLSLLGLVWFVAVSYGLGLREQPRYYTVPAIMAVMLIGIGVAQYGQNVPRRFMMMIMGLLISVNLLCFYVDNDNPLYEERAVIRLAKEMNETIYTDRNLALMANSLIKITRASGVVSGAVPPPGAIYLYAPCKEENVPCNVRKRPEKNPEFDPEKQKAEWKQIWRDDPGRKILGIAIEKLGMRHFVPESIYYKLDYPSLPVTAYRVTERKSSAPDGLNKAN